MTCDVNTLFVVKKYFTLHTSHIKKMYINFEKMPLSARLWVYQAERTLTKEEKTAFEEATTLFINQWTAHQATLNASFCIKYNRFLVVAVDESATHASGCSIDKLTHFLQHLQNEFKMQLLDRLQLAFLEENLENQEGKIITFALKDVKNALENGEIKAKTLFFNNSINTLEGFQNEWLVSIENSWLKQRLPSVTT